MVVLKTFSTVVGIVLVLLGTAATTHGKQDKKDDQTPGESVNVKKMQDALIYAIKEEHENGNKEENEENENIDGGSNADRPISTLPLIWKDNDKLLVQITSSRPEAEVFLRPSLESEVDFESVACSNLTCSGYLDITLLDDAKALASVLSIKPSMASRRGTVGSGSLVSGAVFAHTIDKIVQKYPSLDGSGIKIGVLSDSYDTDPSAITSADDDIASGDLPPDVHVLKDYTIDDYTVDEGRAMLQLIHDIAPGAELAFYTAWESQEDFAAGIWALAEAGCDVIVDDIIYFAEPFFQEGIIAQAANDVAALYGVPYFSAAGNQARNSWEGPFVNSGIDIVPLIGGYDEGCIAHNFGGGNIRQEVTVSYDSIIILQWDQPFYSINGGVGSQSDIDILVLERGTWNLVAGSADFNIGLDPLEWFLVPTGDFDIVICKYGDDGGYGPDPGLLKWIGYGGFKNVDPPAEASTVVGHANTPNTAGVGAAFDVQLFSELVTEYYSSAGGTPLLFERDGSRKASPQVLQQPRFVGFDGSLNTFLGESTSYYWPLYRGVQGYLFFGTSAAATNVAAIAAIMLQANPSLTPMKVYEIMQKTAIDMSDPGFDFDTGYGAVSGLECVEMALGQKKRSKDPYCSPYTASTSPATSKPKRRRAITDLQVREPVFKKGVSRHGRVLRGSNYE